MPPALIAAGVTAAASIGGALLSSKAQKNAANTAASAESHAADVNNQLARDMYAQNSANFTPYMQSGSRANALIDSFLYGPQPQATVQPAPQPATSPMVSLGGYPEATAGPDFALGMTARNGMGQRNLALAGRNVPGAVTAAPQAMQPAVAQPSGNALSGYAAFQASPYYQFPLQEGQHALDHRLAASGMNESGAGIKAAIRYGQDYGSQRINEFLNLARGQQQTGFGSASALAGVGQNTTALMTQNNQGAADALANAALLRGQANASLYGSAANALGTALGSSYKYLGF